MSFLPTLPAIARSEAGRRFRYALRTAAALLAGLPLPWLLRLEREDPLWTTVQIAPAALVALWQLELWAAAHGGRTRPWRGRQAEAGLFAGWLLLVGLRSAWAAPGTTPLLAAAYFVGLGWRAGSLVLRLRPALGRALPSRPPTPFFWLPLVVYLAVLPWSMGQRPPDGDEPYYLLVAHSLVYDGDADLADNYLRQDSRRFVDRALEPQPGDPVGPQGQRYSRHNLLLPLLLAIPYRVAGAAGAAAAMAALTALLGWCFLRAARAVAPERAGEALLAWACLVLSPPLLLYAHQFWVEVPAALLILAAWEVIGRPAGSRTRRDWLLLLATAGLLVFLKLRFVAIAAPLLLVAVAGSRRRRPALLGPVLFAAFTVAILLFNRIRFGSALKTYSFADLGLFDRSPVEYLLAASGLWFDAAFGLFGVAPIWLLLLPGLVLAGRSRPRLLVSALLVLGPYFGLLASRAEWFGGWSPPFRYGLPALPILALLAFPALAERRRAGARALLAALALATAAMTLVWLVVPGWTYNLADGGSHVADALANTLGVDVNRLLPSMVRPRAATWVVPLALTLLTLGLWHWRRRAGGRPHAAPAAALVLVAAAVPLLGASLPSRVVEVEDPPTHTRGGRLYPSAWTVERVRWPSGVLLPEGARLAAPIVPGGERVRLRIRWRGVANEARPIRVVVGDGQRRLHRVRVRGSDTWSEVEVGPVDWVPGRELVVSVAPPPGAVRNGLVVDKVWLEWR